MNKWLLLMLTTFLLAACGANNNQIQQTDQQIVNVKNSTIPNTDRATGQDVSKRLVHLASSIPNVNDATAVVLGKYAIVGIDVNKNLERSEVGSIKYSVAESLKNDPHGARAIIVADPDINARLREISEDIQRGEPIQGIMNELADIAGRLMPEIPADIIEPDRNKVTEEQKKNLNNQEENQLDKQQQKQSNFHKENNQQ